MTRDELSSKLRLIGVHESSYSFGAIRNSECVCLVQDGALWKIYYVERDEPEELAAFVHEDEANDFIFRKFSEWHGLA